MAETTETIRVNALSAGALMNEHYTEARELLDTANDEYMAVDERTALVRQAEAHIRLAELLYKVKA